MRGSRLPPALCKDRDELDRKRDKRRKLVAQDIIPNLKGKLFDSMSTRVARYSVEQKLVEFELPKPASDQIYISVPDDAMAETSLGSLGDLWNLQSE